MNLYKFFTTSAFSLLLLGVAGCTEEVEYTPAGANTVTGPQIYFSSAEKTSFDLVENQNSVTVYVTRANKSGSATATIKSSAATGSIPSDIFTVPSSVTFADGAETAPIEIKFDFDLIEPETTYTVTLELEGDDLSNYGKTTQFVDIIYAPWSEWKKMDGDCQYVNAAPWGFVADEAIFERKSLLNPNLVQYNIPELIAEDQDFIINVDLGTGIVTVPVQNTTIQSGGDDIMFCDSYTFFTEVAKGTPENYYGNSRINKETGLISINIVFYMLKSGGGISWWGDSNYDTCQLPGYPNYNITVANAGTFISEAGQEYAILTVTPGSDVASYAIVLKQGYLNAEQVAAEVDAIIADTNTTLYNEGRDFQFPITEEDDYTVITVSYDTAGDPKGSNSYSFFYELNAKDWNEGWKVVATDAEFGDVFFAGIWWNKVNTWEVEVQESLDEPGYYRIVKPYGSNPYEEPTERGHYYVYIDATNPDAVVVDPSLTSYGYYVLSSASGKLVDGRKFVFPANSLGVFNGYNEDGTMNILARWNEEATLLNLDPSADVEEETPDTPASSATRSLGAVKSTKATVSVQKNLLMPFTGKKPNLLDRPMMFR